MRCFLVVLLFQLPLLKPETMTDLEVSILRFLSRQDAYTTSCMQSLWQVALRNQNTDHSKLAMSFISDYYLKAQGFQFVISLKSIKMSNAKGNLLH